MESQVMMKLKKAKNLDARQNMLLEHAYYQARPPSPPPPPYLTDAQPQTSPRCSCLPRGMSMSFATSTAMP